eukprot:c21653_g1_i1 orf=736-2304(-)
MGRKKFIDKKNSATYRLVFKESSSGAGGGFEDGSDRVFVRVDGGDAHVPGFDPDTEEEDEEIEEEKEQDRGRDRGRGHVSEHGRRELLELGFPDDGYNYLQHLREVGPSGRIGSFVPINRVRLDPLRPDVKAYDASKVQVHSSAEENDSNALIVSGSARTIRGAVSKVVDSDVVALLDREDGESLVSSDELEDDFVAMANEGVEDVLLEESGSQQGDVKLPESNNEHFAEVEDFDDDDDDDQHERPARFLDEQFELLALREYDDDEIGELDDDDFLARGPAHISKFDNVMSDFLINSTCAKDKYQTPAEIKSTFMGDRTENEQDGSSEVTQGAEKAGESGSMCLSSVDKSNIRALAMLDQSASSEEEMELIVGSDSDEDEGHWDCETVVTTYSNLENHPGKICAFPKDLNKSTRSIEDGKPVIRLRGRQQLPLDYLPKRNNLLEEEKKKTSGQKHNAADAQRTKVRRRADETKEDKKARKAAVKEEKRLARVSKKDTKLMYKDESQRAQRTAAFTGPATVHL